MITKTMLSKDYIQRFQGFSRLYGEGALHALNTAHFVVVGLGGVGTWAAEALARSGIGELTLIELDDVCISNTNRQSHAMRSTIGRPKNEVICQRLCDINPEIQVHCIHEFLHKNNMHKLIDTRHDVVIDAMDATHIKAALIAYCSARKIRLIVSGSSGGKQNPNDICVSDLGITQSDPMLAKIRNQLYRKYKFSRDKGRKFRIDAVYSKEQMRYPKPDGSVCQTKQFAEDSGVKLDCANGFGSSVMVTGSFGFTAAHTAIKRYLEKQLNR